MAQIKAFINRSRSWIGTDGLLHFESCALIAAVVGLVFPWWAGAAVAVLAGIGKEVWDIWHGTPSWHDLICDITGALVGALISLL